MKFAAATVVALIVLAASWSLLHHGTLARGQIVDTPLYEQYADKMLDGAVPYRDVDLEYPPGALPSFLLPAASDRYQRWFDREMLFCASLLLVGVALSLRALGAPPRRFVPALALVALAPLLLGSVVLSRFDMWPAALVALALAALLWERLWLAAPLLGLAIGAKLWPVVLLPLAVLWLRGRRGAWFAAGVTGVVAAVFAPFAVIAPSGVWQSVETQLTRPLQLESLGGALLVASHHLLGTGIEIVTQQSQNVAGTGARVLAIVLTVLTVAGLLFVYRRFARGTRTADELVAACAAAVATLLAFGKVFSPQFMVWLLPLVPLVPSATAGLLLALTLLLTQSWFPRHYWDLANGLRARESFALVLRDAFVVALAYVTAASSSRASSSVSRRSGARTSS